MPHVADASAHAVAFLLPVIWVTIGVLMITLEAA
jgi:hypothetical protein